MTSNYNLIQKQYNLTRDEYLQLYNNLLRDKLVYIPFNLNTIDYMINKLKYLSKSWVGKYPICPKQFDYARVKNVFINDGRNSNSGIFGSNAHFVFNKVWNKLSRKLLTTYTNKLKVRNYIYLKCRSFVPENEKKILTYKYLFLKYANYETYRIFKIREDIGNNRSWKYIKPIYRELRIENHNNCDVGVIDVIHRKTTDTIAIGDYKTGKPKYYNLRDNPKVTDEYIKSLPKIYTNYDKKTINFELGSYFRLLSSNKNIYKVVTKDGINILEDLKGLTPTSGFVLYIQDWKNTFKYIPFNIDMLREYDNLKKELINDINLCKFKRKPSNKCFDFCPYILLCLQSDDFKNYYKQIDPRKLNILKKFDYLF